ncbi:ABC transporter permease [Bosea sp. UC22_33]|uniref:ABC transporter permease n=1 Tax=Bosea sp. UC22_33 TaxID=3350165 RepID=UPI00366DECB0
MTELILRRLGLLALILLFVSFMTFMIVNVLPGDVTAVVLGDTASPEQAQILRERLGLNAPVILRYLYWLAAMLHGDFGVSLVYNQPISTMLAGRLFNSMVLALLALAVAIPVAIGLGVIAAMYRGAAVDRLISAMTAFTFALPEFVKGLALVLIFGIWLQWLPGSSLLAPGENPLFTPSVLILPVAVVAISMLPYFVQITRAGMIEAFASDYVRTAILKGMPSHVVALRHALRNGILPAVAVIGMTLGNALGGLVIVETVFSYSGIGQLMVSAINSRDIPIIQSTVMIIAATYAIGNLLADLVSIALNPRLRG